MFKTPSKSDEFSNLNPPDIDNQDVARLEEGMVLLKLNGCRKGFNERFYRIDLKNKQIVANSKQFMKSEKKYLFVNLNEVKSGSNSEDFKAFRLKQKDKKISENVERTCFVITHDSFRKTLDLRAHNEQERDRWVRVIKYFINTAKQRNGPLSAIDNKTDFKTLDKTNDNKLSKKEISSYLESLNIQLNKNKINDLIKKLDVNGDGELDAKEFENLVNQIYRRTEIISLFKLISEIDEKPSNNNIPSSVSFEKFKKFLVFYQKENNISDEQIKNMIIKYEPKTQANQPYDFSLTLSGLINYLNDDFQLIEDNENNQVTQNMNLTFANYFINSSHNTYLIGDQLTSMSSTEGYMHAIMNGARLVEMDLYDGPDGPVIFHSGTLTSKLLFEDALIAIKEYAFKLTDYPLIITIELHCSKTGQIQMGTLIKKHIYEYMYLNFDENFYPTLNQLKRKIVLRCRKPKNNDKNSKSDPNKNIIINDDIDFDIENDDDSNEKFTELSEFINLLQNATFKGVDHAFKNYNQKISTCSMSEKQVGKLKDKDSPLNIIRFTSKFLGKVYPAYYRQDSSNISPMEYWIYGFQIAALNFQTKDKPMELNEAFFNDNGRCGYVLKPKFLLDPSLGFNPLDTKTMPNKKLLEIKIISGQMLPRNDELIKDISDPYVKVSIYGVPADVQDKKTKSIKNNGFNPIWNEDFSFVVNCPELAIVKFAVKDDDFGKDDYIGYYTVKFERIREGKLFLRFDNVIKANKTEEINRIPTYKAQKQAIERFHICWYKNNSVPARLKKFK